MSNDNFFRKLFYQNVMAFLGLKSIKQNNLLHILNKNLKNDYMYTCDNKQMIRIDDMHLYYNQKPIIVFHPLTKLKESCSHLLIDDSIHLYLRNLTFNIFRKIITTKDGTIVTYITNAFDTPQLDNLSNPTKNTKFKFYNLFNILSATSFSKNLISFEIDFTNSPKSAKVNFKYPLYDMLSTIHNNTIFGIHLEDDEIKLFKQIYENYIISKIDDLFKEPIEIPTQSDHYPQFYTLMTIKLMLEEFYWKNYDICFIFNFKNKIKIYKDMLSNLNHYTQYDEFTKFDNIYTEKDQELDQEAYKNELKIRQETEPNWLLLKDDEMGKNKQQLVVIENNNIGQVVDSFGNFLGSYNIKQYNNAINRLNTDMLVQNHKDNYQLWKNDQEWKEIFYLQNLVLDILKTNGGALWYDTRIKKYCFRSKLNGSISEVDSKELGDLLTRALKEKIIHYKNNNKYDVLDYAMEIVLVSKLKGINNQKLSINEKSNDIIKILLFENEIKTIDDDVFKVDMNNEFFKNDNDSFFTRNRFVPNDYLIKRYQQDQLIATASTEQTFIENFIYHLVKENQELSDYIINWLAYYFQNLQKSKTALVLLGEQEVTKDIFWNIIIKEIFSKQYCTTIDDKECDTTLVSEIAKDKLFFHIGDIDDPDTMFDDETLALIIKDLLIKPSVTTDTNEEIYIHGQILITAKNPAPYLKKVLSKCTVIEINNIDTIMQKLDVEDEAELEDAIYSDLNNFTDRLVNYKIISENALTKVDTEARQILKGNESSNVNKDDINKRLDDFIQAIKDKDTDYFEKVYGTKDKKGGDVYEHLKYAFNKDDGYFIGQDMYLYYNAINELPFKTNKPLMDRLKIKDKMFRQEVKVLKILTKDGKKDVLFSIPSGGKETGNKDLYRIADYKLAEDIKIPDGATVISSQEKLDKFTFTSKSEEEKCIQRSKEYKDKKKKEKEQN